MNRAEIRLEARRILAQASVTASYYTDPDFNAWINDGIRDMCIKAGVYVRSLTLSVVAGVDTYYLPWQFLHAKNILTPSGGTLDEAQVDSVGRIFVIAGLPISYFLLTAPITLTVWTGPTPFIIWSASGNFASTYMAPATPNGYMYECVVAGTTGASLPAYPTVVGQTLADGTVTWKTRSLISSLKQLILTAPPTVAMGGVGDYTLFYTALDDGLSSDTESPNFPLEKHHYLIAYVCYRAAEKAKQSALTNAFLTEYATGLGLSTPQIAGGQPESATRQT